MKITSCLLGLYLLAGANVPASANPQQVVDCTNSDYDVAVGLSPLDAQDDRLSLTVFDKAARGDSFETIVPKGGYKVALAQSLEFTGKADPGARATLRVAGGAGHLVIGNAAIDLVCK